MANASSHTMPAERVCDYPRPPLVELVEGVVTVSIGGECIATTDHYVRVCETYHPPHHLLATHGLQTWEPASF